MVDTARTDTAILALLADGQPSGSISPQDMRDEYVTLRSRSFFSVTQYGAKGDGSTNDSTAFQAALDACAAVGGGIVYVPPTGHYYKLSTGVTLANGVKLMGAGTMSHTRPEAFVPTSVSASASWILCSDATNSAVSLNGAGAVISGINFTQTQPADSNPWTPTTWPYVITVTNLNCVVEHIVLCGVSHGIHVNGASVDTSTGGQFVRIYDIMGAPYVNGIFIEESFDTVFIDNVSFETLFGNNQVAYTGNHGIAIKWGRCDNPVVSNVQIQFYNYGMTFANGTSEPWSVVNGAFSNICIAECSCCLAVAATTTTVNATWTGCEFQSASNIFGISIPALYMLSLGSDNVEMNFASGRFQSDNHLLVLGNGGAGTANLMGFPNVTFGSTLFLWNQSGTNANCFNIAANAKVTTSAQLYRNVSGTGSKKSGSGTLIEATETTS